MTSYRDAGVDLDEADRLVDSMSEEVTATWGDRVTGSFGGFAAGVELPDGYEHPILMMSTDGVGTKLDLARRSGRWQGVGWDLVAMCVDDLAAVGAKPVGFVDYLAVGAIHPDRDLTIVTSVAEACSAAGCPLLGGETAEHPGVMDTEAIDLAGTALGVVDRDDQIGSHLVAEGDSVVGLHSPNLRSNGFSLIRAVLGEDVDAHAETLLEPSIIYSPAVISAVTTGGVHAAAHITGGGLASNIGRVIPDGLGAVIDMRAWEVPDVFHLIAERGVEDQEMLRTFNMGIGFCLVVDPAAVSAVLEATKEHNPRLIGVIGPGESVVLE